MQLALVVDHYRYYYYYCYYYYHHHHHHWSTSTTTMVNHRGRASWWWYHQHIMAEVFVRLLHPMVMGASVEETEELRATTDTNS